MYDTDLDVMLYLLFKWFGDWMMPRPADVPLPDAPPGDPGGH